MDSWRARAEWARRWHALGKLPYGETYNAALQRLTDAFAQAGSLSQLRATRLPPVPDPQ